MFKRKICLLSFCMVMFWPVSSLADNFSEIKINSQIPGEGTGVTHISGFTFTNKEVVYEKKNGLAIFEGDIVLGTIEEVEKWQAQAVQNAGSKSVIITGQHKRWIDNLVPFEFDENVSTWVKQMVIDAMTHWELNTTIRFVERTNYNANIYPDYVRIISDDYACWSNIGRNKGVQRLNVVARCGFGVTVHELGHTIGLWHEHSREDRDNFVTIHYENIRPGKEDNFQRRIDNGDDIGIYDYGSIMHYTSTEFGKTNDITGEKMTTITPRQPNVIIGQRVGLSELDIASILENYPKRRPVANISKTYYSVFLGNSTSLNGSYSFDPNGNSLSYFWNFGDGVVSSAGPIVNHIYDSRGEFNISLTVTDPDGIQGVDTATAFVYGVEVLIPIISLIL